MSTGLSFRISTAGLIWVPLRLHLGVSCFWRLLIFEGWLDRKPFGGAKKLPITFIRELMQQVRLGVVLFGKGQFCGIGWSGRCSWHLTPTHQKWDSSAALAVRSL
ncbi:MAG: hypothetical protein JWQ17_1355 [Tardiphaga sp.]|nr:hypothetical protein [Tardiphaga sp.]